MNNEEISVIKKTWEIPAAAPTDSGVAILIAFFTKYPSNLQKFPSFLNVPMEELKGNARFKAHANRVVKVFDESIKTLDLPSDEILPKLQEIWSKIATTHFQRQIEKKSFNELKEAILEVLTAACKLDERQAAIWVKLMDTVYGIIFKTLDQLKEGKQ